DVELAVDPLEAPQGKYEIALSVAKDSQGKDNGYVLRFRAGDSARSAGAAGIAQLLRQGSVIAERTVSDDASQFSSASIRRCGKYVVGLLNGWPVVSYRDENPLVGSKVAYYSQGVTLRTEATRIASDTMRDEWFSRAPTAWRTAGAAIAEVTNRWQSDPRWTFFSLKNDRAKGKPAVLWSKFLYPGDVTLEFFFANKMECERGQPYAYARDVNVTICSDGSDLTKGYTFMFGGRGNQGSMILRNGVEVARHQAGIPTDMNYMRYWFSYKIEKRGGNLTFRVDRLFAGDRGQSELVYEDAQPLSGDRIAIWTYDHAIMLSRVRLSGEGGTVAEHPDWRPGPLRTPYDGELPQP
ncbi:MAG: hypothetical protein NTW87_34715, partial [Planctomycetota bacterium]|nr:hypothetical protein [Planctomycetota bacterium]